MEEFLRNNWFKGCILLLFFVLISSFLMVSETVFAAKGFLVEKNGSDKILITDGYSEYVIEHDYDCYSSDFAEGITIYIDTYYSPSYGDKIIISGYSDTVCEVTSSESVNIKRYYVDEVFDSDDKIIVTDKNNNQFLVEYGIGCGLSMWRYEGKTVEIDVGGSFLDGIGDRMYLFDSGRDCKIWDAEELNGSSSGGSAYMPPTPTISCPINSSNVGGVCTCNSGYIVNELKTACVYKPILTCPVNSSLGADNKCYCVDGYIISGNSSCITYNQNCQNQYGINSYGDKINCYCSSGYVWNSNTTACVKIEIKPTIPANPVEKPTPPREVSNPKKELESQKTNKPVENPVTESQYAQDIINTSTTDAVSTKREEGRPIIFKIFESVKNFFSNIFK